MIFLRERQEVTVYNALAAIPRYIQKYGTLDAFLELFYRFNLTQEELNWVINKSFEKGYIDEDNKDRVSQYTKELR